MVGAAVGGVSGGFILDLAAPQSALHVTVAEAHDVLDPIAQAPLRVGRHRLGTLTLPVLDLDQRTGAFDGVTNGVLGWDVWRRFDLTLATGRGACHLRLVPRRAPASQSLPWLAASVTDGARIVQGRFAVGTGQWETRVSAASPARPPEPGAPLRLRAISLSGRLSEEVPAALPQPAPEGLQGVLGQAVLSKGTVSVADGQARFEPARRSRIRPRPAAGGGASPHR